MKGAEFLCSRNLESMGQTYLQHIWPGEVEPKCPRKTEGLAEKLTFDSLLKDVEEGVKWEKWRKGGN